jgi:hypothetical protein
VTGNSSNLGLHLTHFSVLIYLHLYLSTYLHHIRESAFLFCNSFIAPHRRTKSAVAVDGAHFWRGRELGSFQLQMPRPIYSPFGKTFIETKPQARLLHMGLNLDTGCLSSTRTSKWLSYLRGCILPDNSVYDRLLCEVQSLPFVTRSPGLC